MSLCGGGTKRAVALASLLSLIALAPGSARGRELWSSGGGDVAIDWSGSLRERLTVAEQTSAGDFEAALAKDPACFAAATFADCSASREVGDLTAVQSLTRLRTRLDASLPAGFSALLVYDHELLAGHLDTFEAALGGSFEGQTLLGAESVIERSDHAEWRHRLYRGLLRFESGPLEVEVGRQRIAWGVGRLWNPIDRLNAIGPLAIEADQSAGIDAVHVRWSFAGLHGIELVYAPARATDDDRYAARMHATLWDTDVSAMGGLFQEAPTVGVDLARNLGEAAVRLEAVWTDPERAVRPIGSARAREPDPFWQVVASLDYNVDIGTGLYVLVEHLYNGHALGFGSGTAGRLLPLFEETPAGGVVPASAAVFGGSQVVSGARQQSGLQLGYDLTPELRGELLVLADWSGESAIFFPGLRYSPSGSVELSAGVQAGAGPRRSEYGSAGVLGYLLVDYFF